MARKARRKKQVTPERLMELSFAYAPPLIISAGVSNKVFDCLEDGAKTPEQLAEETGASARALRILMNALVGLSLLKKDRQGKYSLTPESAAFLLSKTPGTDAGFFGTIAPQIISRWLRLSDIVREGRPAVAVNRKPKARNFSVSWWKTSSP
jgi:Dimerisation domain